MKITLIFAALLPLCLSGCGDKPAADAGGSTASTSSGPPGTEAGAKEVIGAFVKPGADHKALTAALKPDKADYEAVFAGDAAGKAEAGYAPFWASGQALTPNEGQTAFLHWAVPTADIKTWSKNASDNLPGGYEGIKDSFKDGLTIYAGKFVKPGETSGMTWDGLVHVNGHWRLFFKPFKALK